MKVLITGGLGYLGSALAYSLRLQNVDVTILDSCMYGPQHDQAATMLRRAGCAVIYGDVRAPFDFQGIDAVVHAAAWVGENLFTVNGGHQGRSVNVGGTWTMLEGAGKDMPFVFLSTCSNYGVTPAGESAHELSPLKPQGAYAKSKVEAEGLVVTAGATILRLATLYGLSLRMRRDLYINDAAITLALGDPFEVHHPTARRPFTSIETATHVIRVILGQGKRLAATWNVVEFNTTKRDILTAAFPDRSNVVEATSPNDDVRDYSVNGSKMIRDFQLDLSKMPLIPETKRLAMVAHHYADRKAFSNA